MGGEWQEGLQIIQEVQRSQIGERLKPSSHPTLSRRQNATCHFFTLLQSLAGFRE